MTTPSGKEIVFKKDTGICDGMPYIDMMVHQEAFAMIETVRKCFEGFTERQVKDAILAWDEQAMLAYPRDQKFKQMVSHESLKNPRTKPHAITDALAIFGPDRDGLRGKTVRVKPERVETEYVEIPWDFNRLHRFVTLVRDVMFVNGEPFLLTLSRRLTDGHMACYSCTILCLTLCVPSASFFSCSRTPFPSILFANVIRYYI